MRGRAQQTSPPHKRTMAPKSPSQHAAEKAEEAKTAAKEARAEVNEKQFNPSQLAAKKKAESTAWIYTAFFIFYFPLPISRLRQRLPPPSPQPPRPLVRPRIYNVDRCSLTASQQRRLV